MKREQQEDYGFIDWIPLKKAFGRSKVICLICGAELQLLSGHIRKVHGISPNDYRKHVGVEKAQPLCSKNYSAKRRQIMKEQNRKARETVLTSEVIRDMLTKARETQAALKQRRNKCS